MEGRMMPSWKIWVFIVLMSYVTASTAEHERSRGRAQFAMVLGLYSTCFVALVFTILEMYLRMVEAM
jgi:heme/copper-type cytochrome/quinol oxidase subunit 3